MSASARPVTVLCNGATSKSDGGHGGTNVLRLDYLGKNANVKIKLPDFVRNVVHLPDRVLDLLEIAAYIFAADRSIGRGEKESLEFHAWSRSLRFVVKVRDHAFWKRQQTQQFLAEALSFMSGDRGYEFQFHPGHATPATSLFDREGFAIASEPNTCVAMFSGGLDSLAGTVNAMADSGSKMCLVSHQSGQTGTIRTQNRLFDELNKRFPRRLAHYKFKCGLQGERAQEETQRTRSFLYISTAFALAQALNTHRITAYENGITAINFSRRGDLLNARASRTAHPKTIWLMQRFLSEVLQDDFHIETPYLWKTKTDVMNILAERNASDLITSAVSCSKTFQKLGNATQCGGCSQCIDRRFAAYAARLHDVDEVGLYALDFLKQSIQDGNVRTTLVDYVRQAMHFAQWNLDYFQQQLLSELADVAGYVDGLDDQATLERTYALCHRHGEQVAVAIQRMREVNDDPFSPVPDGSFLKIVGDRAYLAEPEFDYRQLSLSFDNLPTGKEHAAEYEKLVKQSLAAIFYPDLTSPTYQQRVDDGRMKIDITFDNKAERGFFATVRDEHHKRCPYIFFECKNYSCDVANPEFDQLESRMHRMGCQVGFIVCRSVDDEQGVLKQCQDRSGSKQGDLIVLVLGHHDLKQLLQLRAENNLQEVATYLENKLKRVLFKS